MNNKELIEKAYEELNFIIYQLEITPMSFEYDQAKLIKYLYRVLSLLAQWLHADALANVEKKENNNES